MTPIKKQIKGGPLIFTKRSTVNQAVGILNAVINMKVAPGGVGTVQVGDGDATLDMSEYVQDVKTRIEDGEGRLDQLESKVNIIFAALANSSITAVCNTNGTITVTLTFPGIQPQTLT